MVRIYPTIIALVVSLLIGCGDKETLKVGAISGPETELLRVAKAILAKKGIASKIVTFHDYRLPNMALIDGDIDANVFQHKPYLDYALSKNPAPLISVGKTFIYPMGLYSQQVKQLEDLKNGATIAIPNDPSNLARALYLLADKGLIGLRPDAPVLATLRDIDKNPKHFVITPLDAANLPRILQEAPLAAINLNYALPAHLDPKQSLGLETTKSHYANLIVTRKDLRQDKRIIALVEALHHPDVVARAQQLFANNAICAWKSS